MHSVTDRYVVVLADDSRRGFGDELEDAIGYAADAKAGGVSAEVWVNRREAATERIWPELVPDAAV